MDDPELKAIGEITKSLDNLSEEQRRNILVYVNSRYRSVAGSRTGARASFEGHETETPQFADVGSLFDAANPQTEDDRVLLVAYWHQVAEKAETFEALPVSKQLKQLGHRVSNITRALDSLIRQTPCLILQVGKSGTAKQARKRYKVTREGIKRVQKMLNQANGGENAS